MTDAFLGAAAGTGFTFACTALGAAAVFLIRGKRGGALRRCFWLLPAVTIGERVESAHSCD
ncbi:MAG: hypothetical protein ACLT98_03670 [Eggerthellaceae bacterium]